MENDKAHREKVYAYVSLGMLVCAVFFVFFAVTATAFIKADIEQDLCGFIISVTSYPYVILLTSLILILIIKEMLIRPGKVTFFINLFVIIASLACLSILLIVSILSLFRVFNFI